MTEIKKKRLPIILIALESLLLIPLIAMQFTSEVNWSQIDFFVFGVLLFVVGLLAEVVLRIVKQRERRFIWIAFLILVFLLLWAELAVGVFGSPIAGN